MLNSCTFFVFAALLCAAPSDTAPAADAAESQSEPATADEQLEIKEWEFSATLAGYFPEDDEDYPAFTFTADRDWLHLEGRYNYENLDTVSAFFGYNIAKGERFTFELTPMIGGVIGRTDAIAPGYEMTLGYKWIELYTEGEFVFDLHTSDDDYFYSWSELTVSPVDWFFGGVAAQRTKAREMDREIQLGPMLGFTIGPVDVSFYWFDPGNDDQTFSASFTINF